MITGCRDRRAEPRRASRPFAQRSRESSSLSPRETCIVRSTDQSPPPTAPRHPRAPPAQQRIFTELFLDRCISPFYDAKGFGRGKSIPFPNRSRHVRTVTRSVLVVARSPSYYPPLL